MLRRSSLCMLLGLIFVFPVPELLCPPIFQNSGPWLGVSGLTGHHGNSPLHHFFNIITHYYVSIGKERTGSRGRLDSTQ